MIQAGPWSEWATFVVTLVVTMVVDRLICRRHSPGGGFHEALQRSALWLFVGLGFSLWVVAERGVTTGVSYLTAYLLEKSLSVDNLFVFLVIFRYFRVDDQQQKRILLWGVAGAIVLRAIFIVLGTELLSHFRWTFYVFGAFLVVSGIRLARGSDKAVDPSKSWVLRLARRYLRTTKEHSGSDFFTTIDGVLYVTPLFLVLLVVEISDLVFAVDSVPAVLGITVDLYVVYTSNIMAILGLRALYFLLSGMMGRFHKLDWALSAVLVFVGVKMIGHDFLSIPNWVSLCTIGGLLCAGIGASFVMPAPSEPDQPPTETEKSELT